MEDIPANTNPPSPRYRAGMSDFRIGFVAIALLLAGCSSSRSPTAGPDHLTILDNGRVFVTAPDGSGRVELSGGETVNSRQPTWSPDGSLLAWVELGTEGSALVTARPDGSERTTIPMETVPFYLNWDPSGSRIAYLGNGATAIDMGIIDVTAANPDTGAIDTGQPYYFSWAPDGESLLVHVGDNRLERLTFDGEASPLPDRPGAFQAPAWSPDGGIVVYAARSGGTQHLIAAAPDGSGATELAGFVGFMSFVLSPDGQRVAYRSLGRNQDATPVALRAAPIATSDQLAVVGIGGGEPTVVSDEVAIAFFWSPAGDRLLFLTPAGAGFRWRVWDGVEVTSFDPFAPSREFSANYLPFFDQFAQSLTPWAPDGTAFTYSGRDASGDLGIWVQSIDAGAPVKVTTGDFAAWSP